MVSIAFFPLLKKSSPPGEQVCALNIFIAQKKCNLKNIAKASFKRKNLIECEISSYTHFTNHYFIIFAHCARVVWLGAALGKRTNQVLDL